MNKIFLFLLAFSVNTLIAQEQFTVEIEPITVANAPGLHSFTWGKSSANRWVVVGGRIDGLHQRQPFAAFAESENNKNIFVIDPDNNQSYSTSLSVLPADMYEQLQSTNQQFIKEIICCT